jgi:hypothetical protein
VLAAHLNGLAFIAPLPQRRLAGTKLFNHANG